MQIAILSFFAVFMLVASVVLFVTYLRDQPQQVPDAVGSSDSKKRSSLQATVQNAGRHLGVMLGKFESVLPKSQAEASVLRQRLIRAGYRSDSAVRIFYGGQFVLMVAMVLLALVTGLAKFNYLFVMIASVAFGFLSPGIWLGRKVASRQRQINRSLPDLIDLLIICVEAGLSLDQATARTVEEMDKDGSAIADELNVVVLEQRVGALRSEAWKHFAERTDVESVRNLVSMLIQSEQFGTSIAKTLRVHSETLRTKRVQEVEEQAAKTTIKILFPLVLFIFPSLFLVTLGPAMIVTLETLQKGQ